ncbi:MAG: hypothetical protein H0X62_13445 [Bacteroidetes bacterium]|jgi:hypothetical protein|nr:hypothetical protein [Bacteroidota bacterium]
MKTLKENTVNVTSMPAPFRLNIFSTPADHPRYFDISALGGKRVAFGYEYAENGSDFNGRITLVVPDGTAQEIKEFVINKIEEQL